MRFVARAWRWMLLPLILCLWGVAQAEVRLSVRGVEGELRDNVRNYVGSPASDDPRIVRRFIAGIPDQVRQALEALGYYEADISVETRMDGETRRVRITVDPGEPVRIRNVTVVFGGDALGDPAFLALGEQFPFAEGDVLHHGRYESYKRSIESLAVARGYFDGHFRQSRVVVHRAARQADVTLDYDGGRRYSFGPVQFSESPLSDDLLQRFVPFGEGDPFTSDQVALLNRNLLRSDYFQSVRVRPQAAEADEEGRVPVVADVTAQRPNRIGTGIGYATDVGPRLRLNWRRPWVNEDGHSIRTESEFSAVRQNISSTYTIPLDPPLDERLQFLGGYQREDVQDTESRRITAGVQRQRMLRRGWQQNYFLRWERERFVQADVRGNTTLTLPGTSISRSRSRGGMDVHWGDRQFGSVEMTHPELGSSIRLARLRLSTKWLRSIGPHRGIVRAEYGALTTEDLDQTPPSLRFFAGGDQSVRGFAYQSLGPRNEDGDLIGGRYLAVGSAEYSYEFRERWRAATFIDVGNAFARAGFNEGFERGAGVGVRWQSPVGPIRLDLAWALSEDGTPWRIHFSMGPEI